MKHDVTFFYDLLKTSEEFSIIIGGDLGSFVFEVILNLVTLGRGGGGGGEGGGGGGGRGRGGGGGWGKDRRGGGGGMGEGQERRGKQSGEE